MSSERPAPPPPLTAHTAPSPHHPPAPARRGAWGEGERGGRGSGAWGRARGQAGARTTHPPAPPHTRTPSPSRSHAVPLHEQLWSLGEQVVARPGHRLPHRQLLQQRVGGGGARSGGTARAPASPPPLACCCCPAPASCSGTSACTSFWLPNSKSRPPLRAIDRGVGGTHRHPRCTGTRTPRRTAPPPPPQSLRGPRLA